MHAMRSTGVWTIALGVLGGAMMLGGCGAPMERAARPGEGRGGPPETRETWEGSGGSWALVMQSPRTAQMLAGTDARSAAEYSRNDGALGAGRAGPLLATSEWPERERPDLYYARRVQLETRASELLYFDTGSRYSGYRGGYRGSYGSGGGGYERGSGTWGFWQ